AERYERGSVCLTSNLPFSKWEQIFKDPMTTAAAIDRLVHHSVIVELNVASYRLESAKASRTPKDAAPNPPAVPLEILIFAKAGFPTSPDNVVFKSEYHCL